MAIFDGHNDLLLNLWLHHREDPVSAFFAGIENGHLDYPRMLQGGFAGGLFALFVPPQEYIARMTPQYASQRWDPIDILWQQLAILEATYRALRWTLEIVSERGGYRALPRG
ncbi:membrane dipeptidase [Klebsiella pneumoniae subsp. pneumoniae]|nr:membrane dipeptidase [Klebsiella pneumoniae subsp. pneumoniae]